MPTAANPLAAYLIAEQIRVCAHDRLINTPLGAPDRSCVIPGGIAWDDCECGQLVVSIVGLYPSQVFPQQAFQASPANASQSRCGPPIVVIEYLVSILRCAPSGGDNAAPPLCSELDESAQHVTQDAWAVRVGVSCCLIDLAKTKDENGATEILDFAVQDQLIVGPAGLCVGSELRVFVGINNACPCGTP